MVKCSDVLKECTASILRVTELVQVDAEVIKRGRNVSVTEDGLRVFGQSHLCGGETGVQECPKPIGVRVS